MSEKGVGGGGGMMMDDYYVCGFSSYSSPVQLTSMWCELTESGICNHHGLSILYVIYSIYRHACFETLSHYRKNLMSKWNATAMNNNQEKCILLVLHSLQFNS